MSLRFLFANKAMGCGTWRLTGNPGLVLDSNKDVATTLELSTYTVETHCTHIMQKLNLHSSAEIVLYAVRKKIIS